MVAIDGGGFSRWLQLLTPPVYIGLFGFIGSFGNFKSKHPPMAKITNITNITNITTPLCHTKLTKGHKRVEIWGQFKRCVLN